MNRNIISPILFCFSILAIFSARVLTAEECASFDATQYTSICSNLSVQNQTVTPGGTLILDIDFPEGNGACGSAATVRSSWVDKNALLDGVSVATSDVSSWSWFGWSRYGHTEIFADVLAAGVYHAAAVEVPAGRHTLEFTVDSEAPNSCVVLNNGNLAGPWVEIGSGSWATSRPFSISRPGPATPKLVSPRENAKLKSNVKLDWSNVSGATYYLIELHRLTGNTKVTTKRTTKSLYKLSKPSVGFYSWHVKACNKIGCSPWTSSRVFSVKK